MGKKIKIIESADQLGLGGTEYALQLYCKYLDKDTFDVTAVGLYKGGERAQLIRDLGVKVVILDGDFDKLEDLLTDTDVFHWHGYGQVDEKLFKSLARKKTKVILQTNVFGHYKKSSFYDMIDYDLYISEMIVVRRMKLDGSAGEQYGEKRKVLPYPVDIDYLINEEPNDNDVAEFKKANNLNNCFVVGRVGRADDHKFDLITIEGFNEYLKYDHEAKFLLVGATKKMIALINKLGIMNNVVILNNTSDLRQLLCYYKAMDVFLAISNIGESFGMVMAEAMSMKVPVVTVSTPNRDNAQIEVVDNNVTGFSTYRNKATIAAAINELKLNKALALQMGEAGFKKIYDSYRAQNVVNSIEQLILRKMSINDEKAKPSLIVDWDNTLKERYQLRCENLYGRLSFTGKLIVWYYQTNIYKAYKKLNRIVGEKLS